MSYSLTVYGDIFTSTYTSPPPYISPPFVRPSFISGTEDRAGLTRTTRAARYILLKPLEPALSAAYEGGGADKVYKFVADLVSSILREIYSRHGLAFDDRISFSRLAGAGVIDEDTAVYLTTLYMAVEGLFEELEEAEDLDDRDAVRTVLREMAVELQKLINALAGLELPGETTIVNYYTQQLHQSFNYVTMHI